MEEGDVGLTVDRLGLRLGLGFWVAELDPQWPQVGSWLVVTGCGQGEEVALAASRRW